MDSIAVLILAAGLGKRMRSDLPKVLHSAGGRSLIEHVVEAASELSPERFVVVVGHGREQVEQAVSRSGAVAPRFALQEKPLGTGDAVRAALPQLTGFSGTVVIIAGDVPLIRASTLRSLVKQHRSATATISVLTFHENLESAYGRIVRDSSGEYLEKIVEQRDCGPAEQAITEFNSAIYAVDSAFLGPAVTELKPENAQQEYYLTDIVGRASKEGQTVIPILIDDATEVLGVNTPHELSVIDAEFRRRRAAELADAGVKIADPGSVFIDPSVTIAPGAALGPMVILRGKTSIAAGATIEGNALLIDTEVGPGAMIKFGVRAEGAKIGAEAMVGPFAHLRPGTELGPESKIGNFVETKNTKLAKGAKASHLTYLGDADVGAEANIGAGTITCNYDGVNKHKTTIGAQAFIGSNTSLVAPVTIGERATIGAGSAISKDVEPESLAFTRAPQVVKAGWWKRTRGS